MVNSTIIVSSNKYDSLKQNITDCIEMNHKLPLYYKILNNILLSKPFHSRNTDRQTDRYFIDRNKNHYRLICHSNKRDICTCIYKNVSLVKSYDTIHGMTNN